MTDPVYIAGIGLITALGDSPELVDAAVRAGISAHARSDYLTADKHSITMSAIPEDALPESGDGNDSGDGPDLRTRRLLRMCRHAALQALGNWQPEAPIPLLLNSTEAYPEIDYALHDGFIARLAAQIDLPIDVDASAIRYAGRVGVIEAIDSAFDLLHQGRHRAALVGGADTCQFSQLVELLDRDDRLSAQRVNPRRVYDGYIAGEGAGFLLLTRDSQVAIDNGRHRVALNRPGFGYEAGHYYSDHPNLGDGMDRAVKLALAQASAETEFGRIYSSMNGEACWARELAVATMRSHERLRHSLIEHPADCYGDLGAASAAVLIALAQARMLAAEESAPAASLVCCAADLGARAALCLQPQRIG